MENEHAKAVKDVVLQFLDKVQLLEYRLKHSKLSRDECKVHFSEVGTLAKNITLRVTPLVPEHRSIDIQTTDAGPGVGTRETIVRLRLVESFVINDLDYQARFHYAPRDSKSHLVERVMSYLNDACGDGRFINIPQDSIVQQHTQEELLAMTPDDWKKMEDTKNKNIGSYCAAQVAKRYEGTNCMGTTIHSRVPQVHVPYEKFFFDSYFMRKWHNSSKKDDCAGSAYYAMMINKFDTLYIRYNNGVEGIRSDPNFRCPHPIARVPTPVPNHTDDGRKQGGAWHYYMPKNLPPQYENADQRKPDDFNPLVQVQTLVNSLTDPQIHIEYTPDGTIYSDTAHVWQTIQQGLPDIVEQYVGVDLKEQAEKEAEKVYIQKLKRASKALQKKKVDVDIEKLMSVKTGPLKLTITKSRIPAPPPWNGTVKNVEMTNTCTIDNMLYFFHMLQTYRPDIKELLKMSTDNTMKLLYTVHLQFQKGKFAEGKLMWFLQFQQFVGTDKIDGHGSEDQFFFSKLQVLTSTTCTSVCSNAGGCSQPVTVHTGRIVTFR